MAEQPDKSKKRSTIDEALIAANLGDYLELEESEANKPVLSDVKEATIVFEQAPKQMQRTTNSRKSRWDAEVPP